MFACVNNNDDHEIGAMLSEVSVSLPAGSLSANSLDRGAAPCTGSRRYRSSLRRR
jgi:hypothetical protein